MSVDRIFGISEKIKRAKKHICNLESEIPKFLDGKPYKVASKNHPQLPYATTFFVEKADPTPPVIPIISGDAIHNLRSTLDHLAWQLTEVSGGKPGTKTAFPIFDPAKFESKKEETKFFEGKIKDLRPPIQDAIRSIKPYKGGNDSLWAIHHLDIVDKHRLLIATGFASPRFRVQDTFNVSLSGAYILDVGDNIVTINHKVEPQENLEFAFDIVLRESVIFEGKSIIESLATMLQVIENLISDFTPFLL